MVSTDIPARFHYPACDTAKPYMAWIMDGRYNPPAFLRWFENAWIAAGRTGSSTRPRC